MSGSVRVRAACAMLLALSVAGISASAAAPRPARGAADGHRLAQAWCQGCHSIEPGIGGLFDIGPSFQSIADRPGTTALSLKVFWRTSHESMPNLVISPEQAEALSRYILSLKRE